MWCVVLWTEVLSRSPKSTRNRVRHTIGGFYMIRSLTWVLCIRYYYLYVVSKTKKCKYFRSLAMKTIGFWLGISDAGFYRANQRIAGFIRLEKASKRNTTHTNVRRTSDGMQDSSDSKNFLKEWDRRKRCSQLHVNVAKPVMSLLPAAHVDR